MRASVLRVQFQNWKWLASDPASAGLTLTELATFLRQYWPWEDADSGGGDSRQDDIYRDSPPPPGSSHHSTHGRTSHNTGLLIAGQVTRTIKIDQGTHNEHKPERHQVTQDWTSQSASLRVTIINLVFLFNLNATKGNFAPPGFSKRPSFETALA